MKSAYPIILTPTGSGYVVYVPDLDVNTEGDTLSEAIEMASDAIGLCGVTLQDLGREIPPPSAVLPPVSRVRAPPSPWSILTTTAKPTTSALSGKMSLFPAI